MQVGCGFLAHRDYSADVEAHRRRVQSQRPPDYITSNARAAREVCSPASETATRALRASQRRVLQPHPRGPLLGPGLPPARGPWPVGPPRECHTAASGRRSAPPATLPRLHASYGAPPSYLAELAEERRLSEERREAEARAAAERELTPPGCRLLSELERHAGARLLQAALAAGHAEQAAFPLAVNFSAARERRRGALDDRVVRHCCAGTRFECVSLPAGGYLPTEAPRRGISAVRPAARLFAALHGCADGGGGARAVTREVQSPSAVARESSHQSQPPPPLLSGTRA